MMAATATPATAPALNKHDLPHFVGIQRIFKLPVILAGVEKVLHSYVKVKTSNRIFKYSFDKTEKTVLSIVDMLIVKFEYPINIIDDLMCKSLNVAEDCIAIVTYTPEEIYFTTKTYLKEKVGTVLKRADSVKQLTMLDDALSVADKYVDQYLPDKDPSEDDKPSTEPSSKAVKAIRHVNHFSRKLQRRLTRRTIAEAKLLKKQVYDTIQRFVYFADLLDKDPKKFIEKMKAIWTHLSEDELENQKPPENIGQLIEMFCREGARRFVHMINLFVKKVYMVAMNAIKQLFAYITQELFILLKMVLLYIITPKLLPFYFVTTEVYYISIAFIKFIHLENAISTIVDVTSKQMAKYKKLVDELWSLLMLAKDPKAFIEKMKAIWTHLSEDKLENQKPPTNIEQHIEMLCVEGARRFVHVINFVVKNVYMVAMHAIRAVVYIIQDLYILTQIVLNTYIIATLQPFFNVAIMICAQLIRFIHLENAIRTIIDVTRKQMAKYKKLVDGLWSLLMFIHLENAIRTIIDVTRKQMAKYKKLVDGLWSLLMLAIDPKAFVEKMKAIWTHLSEDKLEKEKPPANIEQHIEMLCEEGARRFVHVTNFVVKNIYMVAMHARRAVVCTSRIFNIISDIVLYSYITPIILSFFYTAMEISKALIRDYLLSSAAMIKAMKPEKEAEKPDNKNNASTANNKIPKKKKHNTTSANNKPSPKDENNSKIAHTTLNNGKAQ